MNPMKFFAAAVLTVSSLGVSVGEAQAQRQPSFADRPLDTSKRLYVRRSGTRVYSDPIPRRRRVWRYRRADGRIVTKITADRPIKRKVRRPARRLR